MAYLRPIHPNHSTSATRDCWSPCEVKRICSYYFNSANLW